MSGPVEVPADGVIRYDADRLLTASECARLLGVKPVSFRSMVSSGHIPKPDDPGDVQVSRYRRTPRWRAGTIAQYVASRPSASWKRKEAQ